MDTITGPREERTVEAALRSEPLTAANARFTLAKIEREVQSAAQRRKRAAFFAKNARCITEEARQIYMAYSNGAALGGEA